MQKTEGYLIHSKYAEHRNVTKGYIARLIKEGQLHLIKGKLNVAMSDAELDLKLKHDQLVEVDQVGDPPSVVEGTKDYQYEIDPNALWIQSRHTSDEKDAVSV